MLKKMNMKLTILFFLWVSMSLFVLLVLYIALVVLAKDVVLVLIVLMYLYQKKFHYDLIISSVRDADIKI